MSASIRMPSLRTARLLGTRASGYVVGVGLPIAVTVAGGQLALPAFVFEHLMVVLVVSLAIAFGRGPAVAAAITGGIGDNLLLREPVGRPAITGVRDAVDLALFLAMAIVVGWLVDGVRRARARALEAAERERAAREDLDRLVATMTHDLATPLGAIQGTIQFARKHASLSDVDGARLLARVETAAARATSLVRALADAKSIQRDAMSLERRRLDIKTVVEPIVKMLDRFSDRHPIVLAMDSWPLVVDGDGDRLGRVVENLITNAIKYSPDGGTVEIRLYQESTFVVLTVRDHGIGLPPDAGHKLFELGYRAPQAARVAPGLGIGLYTAAEVVRRHGGRIGASPADGGGTIFTVRLPLQHRSTAADVSVTDIVHESPSRAVH